ncbi:helix-turn-helix domain-containing protein [Streptomyces millisiae]|uniref:Helix-turn-helix transcriptional regulator n=1 Tax=Streptomyces millisiae TaxID=3075542 RepID=A0ABU2LX37_9ACTN|nr:helix-turn-helix transcriptional regulator [Streptomyces sp. DSM 44918]MDT0321843.1 helix-turn-helix transcriptional regulator [Streptomyces sp. DSM 44918]
MDTDVTAVRRELGAHLRAHRALIGPEQAGLPAGGRRRAAGLRREEVAALAGVSVAWYTWLEQGRVAVSRQVVDAVCRVLRMSPAAHRHALELAGFRSPALPEVVDGVVRPETRALIDGWPDSPALVLDDRLDLLAWNAAHRRLWGDPAALPAERRNLLLFLAAARDRLPPEGAEPLLRGLYQHFRASTGHDPEHPRTAEIVRLLTAGRPDVAAWWQCRAVTDFPPTTVTVTGAGRLTFTLLRPVADPGRQLLVQTPSGAPLRT